MSYLTYENNTYDLNPKNHTITFDHPFISSTIDYSPELLAVLTFLYAIYRRQRLKCVVPFLTYVARLILVFTVIAPVLLTARIISTAIPIDTTVKVLRGMYLDLYHNPTTDYAFMLAGDNTVDDHDARKYDKCRPFNGKKGIVDSYKEESGRYMITLLQEVDGRTDLLVKEKNLSTNERN